MAVYLWVIIASTACGYNGSDPIASSTNPRGILTLSNNYTIYDLPGNVFEWVLDSNLTNYGSDSAVASITAATHTTTGILADGVARSAKAQFGPAGTYSTGSNGSGLGHNWVNYSSIGAVMRGGNYNDPVAGGMFHVWLGYAPTATSAALGFRCVWNGDADPCVGTPPIGTVCKDGAIYAGSFDGGKYMVTPSGCNNSSTPTCAGGTDTLQKKWGGSSGTSVNIPGVTDVAGDATPSSSAQRGHVTTPIITAHASVSSDSGADYCQNLVYGGYSDWYLGSKSEMNYIYCKAAGVPSHNTSFPQAAPNCTIMGGKTSDLPGFNTASGIHYLSSTEVDSTRMWKQNFNNGDNDASFKTQNNYGRCMRRY